MLHPTLMLVAHVDMFEMNVQNPPHQPAFHLLLSPRWVGPLCSDSRPAGGKDGMGWGGGVVEWGAKLLSHMLYGNNNIWRATSGCGLPLTPRRMSNELPPVRTDANSLDCV